MPEITFLKCKYDGSVKRQWTGELLEIRGEWMVILYIAGVHVHFKHGELVTDDAGANLFYLNTERPLTVMSHLLEGTQVGIYVDAALPATFDGSVARFVDLDLDIIAGHGSDPYVRDIEDFERQRVRLGYPSAVVDAAWEGIRIGSELLARQQFPFDGSAEALVRSATPTHNLPVRPAPLQ